MATERLKKYCENWQLSDSSWIASTFTSDVFKVRFQNFFAVLKILKYKGLKSESQGTIALRCFNGHGAVRLLKADEGAYLLEFADGLQLKKIVEIGDDSRATEIIADVVSCLHSYSGSFPDGLIKMERNFHSLFKKVKNESLDSIYVDGARLAGYLIETEQEIRVLHGDIHHENILSSSDRGWLAIDPQCLVGERTYDVANTFFNPRGFLQLTETHESIDRRSSILSQRLKIDKRRILQYAFVYGCLSACWSLEDGQSEESTLQIARSIRQFLNTFDT